LYDGKAGNGLEVLHVERDDAEAEMQGRGADDQIREIDAGAPRHLLTMDSPGQSRYLLREWMYGHGLIEFLAKRLAALAGLRRSWRDRCRASVPQLWLSISLDDNFCALSYSVYPP